MRLPKVSVSKKTKRRLLIAAACWLLFVSASIIITAVSLRINNLAELKELFAGWRTPDAGRTVLVVAPHCDDETIAVGGLIRQALESGADVWVVVVTNGDGFRAAVAWDTRSIKPKPENYIEFGRLRQRETLAALQRLGVSSEHVIFLGYPDRGTERMWTVNWSRQYRSPYTNDSRSPYSDSFTPNTPYTGRQMFSDLIKIIRKTNPTDIYIPHPNDQHPDHWAASVFAAAALEELGAFEPYHVGLYLVHRGDWPVPQGLHPDVSLVPPAKLSELDTDWYQFPLWTTTVTAKRQAVGEFKSQKVGVQRFMHSFVRENELFGIRDPRAKIPRAENIRIDGRIEDWDGIEPIILDPADDGIPAHSSPGADLVRVYAAESDARLCMRISVRGRVTSDSIYEIAVHELEPRGEEDSDTTVVTLRRGRPAPVGWQAAYGVRDIEISAPKRKWQSSKIIVSVSTRSKLYEITWRDIDRSAYKILQP